MARPQRCGEEIERWFGESAKESPIFRREGDGLARADAGL